MAMRHRHTDPSRIGLLESRDDSDTSSSEESGTEALLSQGSTSNSEDLSIYEEEEGALGCISMDADAWSWDARQQFAYVLKREAQFIDGNFMRRQAGGTGGGCGAERHFSVALSGGGVRAAAFAAGVLWRLAERGRLKDVEYVTAVSGGSYTAAALASHVIELAAASTPPPTGPALDAWYRQAVASTICRMVANTPYLARDLGKGPFGMPRDNSSCLPRIFDIPIMVGVACFALAIRMVLLVLMGLIPLVEFIEMGYGAVMRANFCADVYAPRMVLVTLLGASSLTVNMAVLMFIIFCVFVLHLLLLAIKTSRSAQHRGTCLWLTVRSVLSVTVRILVVWFAMAWLICGPGAHRFHRYHTVRGGTELRLCQCRTFIMNTSRLSCGDIIWQEDVGQLSLKRDFGYLDYYKNHELFCYRNVTHGYKAERTLDTRWESVWDKLFRRPLVENTFPTALLLLLLALALALLLLPVVPMLAVVVFNIAGPLVLFLLAFFLVQWRVLSTITGERLFFFSEEFSREMMAGWTEFVRTVMLLNMLLVLIFKRLKSAAHMFYRRSMRQAFYAGGKDCTWGQLLMPYCPYFIFCTTINDYMRLEDEYPAAEFAFGTLYTGGERTGYKRTWSSESLAKSSALSGGALDGFILHFYDSLTFRFWLEFLGVHMGNFVRFRRSRAPSTLAKLPGFLCFLLVYGLMYIGLDISRGRVASSCRSAQLLFGIAIISCALLLLVSFFDFLPWLAPLHHSPVIRTIHQASQFYHQSDRPPSVVYLTDGGVLDNTGIVQLLRRRCPRILSVYAGDDQKNVFGSLKEVFRITQDEGLGSFFIEEDPRRSVWHSVLEYVADEQRTYLLLSIRYGTGKADLGIGRLCLVKNRLSPELAREPVRGLLTEAEVLGRAPQAGPDEELGELKQAQLGGCCCDSCHTTPFNACCGKFPVPPTANQWLTPQLFSSLCRLGFAVSEPALKALLTCQA